MDNLFREYARINLELSKLEEKKTNLRQEILSGLIERSEEKHEEPFGVFTVVNKVTWKYSPRVQKLEDRLKLAQLNERKQGKASGVVKPYLMFQEREI